MTAEGIRTALYFGIALGRELRAVLEGRRHAREALARYGRSPPRTGGSSRRCCSVQHLVPRLGLRALGAVTRGFAPARRRPLGVPHYLGIAPPEFALPAPPAAVSGRAAAIAA